jgi:hypothetical protein
MWTKVFGTLALSVCLSWLSVITWEYQPKSAPISRSLGSFFGHYPSLSANQRQEQRSSLKAAETERTAISCSFFTLETQALAGVCF